MSEPPTEELRSLLTLPPDRFSVWQFYTGGTCNKEAEALTAWAAVAHANRLTQTLAAQTGSTCRIIIMDIGDHTVWEWRHGEGLVFIKPEVKADDE